MFKINERELVTIFRTHVGLRVQFICFFAEKQTFYIKNGIFCFFLLTLHWITMWWHIYTGNYGISIRVIIAAPYNSKGKGDH